MAGDLVPSTTLTVNGSSGVYNGTNLWSSMPLWLHRWAQVLGHDLFPMAPRPEQ